MATFLRFKRLSDDFLSITTLLFDLNLLSLLDDNYISGYPARQIRGAPWFVLHHKWSAYEPVEINKIGDEPNDTNFDDHNNHDRAISNLGLFGIHDTDRSFDLRTRRWACPNFCNSFATCPVDLSKIGRQARP